MEVITGRRQWRNWSLEEKARAARQSGLSRASHPDRRAINARRLEESAEPDVNISAVAGIARQSRFAECLAWRSRADLPTIDNDLVAEGHVFAGDGGWRSDSTVGRTGGCRERCRRSY